MSLRTEFVDLASMQGAKMAELCRRFGIARKTGYKWLKRYHQKGVAGLVNHSRRPHRSPTRTEAALAQRVIALRRRHPAWGGRKLHHRLRALGVCEVPSPSTITAILHRVGLIDPAQSQQRQPPQRFQHPRPNDLWQMDFKGWFTLANGRLCHPLTVLDDHSRYAIALRSCADQRYLTVREQLVEAFKLHGLPRAMLMDNGTPWGLCGQVHQDTLGLTRLTVWLMHLDIRPIHGRPYHPQTQGKEERFHRTLKYELLRDEVFEDHPHAQRLFDPWRRTYNHDRPHEALNYATPAQRYQSSVRSLPSRLPELTYLPDDHIRRIGAVGQLQFQRHLYKTSDALAGHPVGLRATATDGLWAMYFGRFHVADLDQRIGRVIRRRCQPTSATLRSADNGQSIVDNLP